MPSLASMWEGVHLIVTFLDIFAEREFMSEMKGLNSRLVVS